MSENGKQDVNEVQNASAGESEDSKQLKPIGDPQAVARHNFRRVLMLLCLVVVAGYFVWQKFDELGNLLVVFFGFGTVILVHEFGHFIVAKLSDIEVEAFSLFMPPTVFGIKRTEKGWRLRFLPGYLAVDEKRPDGSLASFTVGGPRKAGETEYQIGLIPFGGFVKMLGQEDVGQVKSSDNPRSFANKRIRTRLAVIAAGVTFNVITAVAIFITAFLVGVRLPAPVIGGVVPNSPAEKAGLVAGDQVVEINGKSKNLDFSCISVAAALSSRDQEIPMRVRHADGSESDYSLVAKSLPKTDAYRGFGIEMPMTLRVKGVTDPNKLKADTGLLPGDVITSVEGTPVREAWEMGPILKKCYGPEVKFEARRENSDGDGETINAEVGIEWRVARGDDPNTEDQLCQVGSMVPLMKVAAYADPSTIEHKSLLRRLFDRVIGGKDANVPADERPIRKGDVVLAAGAVEYPTYLELTKVAKEHEGKKLDLKLLRSDANGVERQVVVTVVPKRVKSGRVLIGMVPVLDSNDAVVAKTISTEGGPQAVAVPRGATITAVNGAAVSSFYDVARDIQKVDDGTATLDYRAADGSKGQAVLQMQGVENPISVVTSFTNAVPFEPMEWVFKASNPWGAIAMGWRRTVMFVSQTYATFKTLFAGLVSPKELMGPVGILNVSYKIIEQKRIMFYLYFLGLINAAIAVFNFLPFLPLDGGLAALLVFEKVRGKPLNERTQAIMTNAAWILVGTFAIYVTFNDIVRAFFS